MGVSRRSSRIVQFNNSFVQTECDIHLTCLHYFLIETNVLYNRGNDNYQGRLARSYRPDGTMRPLKDASLAGGTDVPGSTNRQKQGRNIATVSSDIFPLNVRPPTFDFKLPEADKRLESTSQLAFCLSLLQVSNPSDHVLEPAARDWLQAIRSDMDEQDRLKAMVTEVIRTFEKDELKDAKAIAEVVYLAPVLSKADFEYLLRDFYSRIDHCGLLNIDQLEGLAQLIQGGDLGHLSADDLVKILELFSHRLIETHQQSPQHMRHLTLAVSHVLDAMADTRVTDLDRERLHEPLSSYLSALKKSSDAYLIYQAAYAYQALLCVPDNETIWQGAMRRAGRVIRGVAGLATAAKGIDLDRFIQGLQDIQKGIEGASKVVNLAATAYKDVISLTENGQSFREALKEGFSFKRKRDWYSALRGADTFIRRGELASFKQLICEAPCRFDPAFQWGVCQRLGGIAINPMWDVSIRQGAIAFLGEIYQDDAVWGQQASVKQWILNILMQVVALPGIDIQRK